MKYKKVNKKAARNLYNNGETIHLNPSKIIFPSMWYEDGCPINKADDGADIHQFNDRVNNFEYYNTCYELGYYAAYYMEVPV